MRKQQYFAPDGSLIEMEFFNCRNVMALVNDPSPSEIAAMAAEIRAGWTEQEHCNRLRGTSAGGQPILSAVRATEGVEEEARFALAKRLAKRRDALERHSLIASFRRQAEAEGLTER